MTRILMSAVLMLASPVLAQVSAAPKVQDQARVQELQQQLDDAKKQADDAKDEARKQIDEAKNQAKAEVAKAREDAKNALADTLNSFKYISVQFGVLPNSDNTVNNFSKLTINYGPRWSSSLTYYARDTAKKDTRDSSFSVGDPASPLYAETASHEESQTTSKRMDLVADVIRFSPTEIKRGSMRWTSGFSLGIFYIDQKETTKYTSTVDAKIGGRDYVVPANGTRILRNRSLSPQLFADTDLHLGAFSVVAGFGALLGARDKTRYSDDGAFLMPGIDDQNGGSGSAPEYQGFDAESGATFSSRGFHFKLDLEHATPALGGFGLHFDYLEKWGNTKSFSMQDKTNAAGRQVKELVVSEVFEERVTYQLAASYAVEALGRYGVVPILRFNANEDRTITTPKEGKRKDDQLRSYDFGVVFRY